MQSMLKSFNDTDAVQMIERMLQCKVVQSFLAEGL